MTRSFPLTAIFCTRLLNTQHGRKSENSMSTYRSIHPLRGHSIAKPRSHSLPLMLGLVIFILVLALGGSRAFAQEPNPDPQPEQSADLGDAPDSLSNHHSLKNTAYAGPVDGRFPTVWEKTPAGEGTGPLHKKSRIVWLGEHVSGEFDADTGPDSDGINNILHDAAGVADTADQDRGDDGWLNRNLPLPDCQEALLKVRISKDVAARVQRMVLNVWIDGNRDGDRADMGKCGDGHSNEWIVQNFAIDTAAISTPFVDIEVRTILVYNEKPDMPAWMRFTLSEIPALTPPQLAGAAATLPDGRGPDFPNAFDLGETEDYLWKHETPQERPQGDFGDAPDNTNHLGRPNTAYPSVPGQFPSVWNGTPAGQPSGPRHVNPHVVWLGRAVTDEKDADLMPDLDGVTNILNGGVDVSNMDGADDGWIDLDHAVFVDCRDTALRVRVSKDMAATTGKMFLNVYFDGNRSGTWGERKECPCDPTAGDSAAANDMAHEWIVQNFVIDTSIIAGSADLVVPTMRVMNEKPDAPAWVRFMLSEQPVTELAPFQHDGRGPDVPKFFELGETEDYLFKGRQQGEVGAIQMKKDFALISPAPLALGSRVSYTVMLKHDGGSAPAHVRMEDMLPAQVHLLRGPFVFEATPHASPLTALFDAGAGPSGTVRWDGHLSPGASVRVEMLVEIRHCPPQDRPEIRNVARAQRDGGPTVEAAVAFALQCERPTQAPAIQLHKRWVGTTPSADPQPQPTPGDNAEHALIAGHQGLYELELNSSGDISRTVVISDLLPAGLVGFQVNASAGVIQLSDDGSLVKWEAVVGPHNRPLRARIFVKPTEKMRCDTRFSNIAFWQVSDRSGAVFGGQSNPVHVRLICRDLGDAPDSTNHFGVPMTAYPDGTVAKFPTVFTVAAPERGPMHMVARPMHLGRGVTEEMEADLGPDVDPSNNLMPRANVADRDERDDGLIWEKFKLDHCQIVRFPVLVSLDAAMLASVPAGQKALGYINVWLDSNRDGDRADVLECPNAAGQVSRALEHIVIDHVIDATALGPGLHTVMLSTNLPVHWDPQQIKRPAWLRVTLSEQPANKPFALGTLQYGDGRGHDRPFQFGETEDYLIRPIQTNQTEPHEGADPVVFKRGNLTSRYDPVTGASVWVAQWAVDFRNNGYATANNTVLFDRLDGPQTLESYATMPVSPTVSGNSLSYALGTLAPSQQGFVNLRSTLPINTPPGTVITNTVTITAPNDTNPLNNTVVVTLTVPLLPPVITYPTPGTVCTGTLTVTGYSQPGTSVEVYIDSALAATVTPDSAGNWNYSTVLADGTYNIHAVARYGSQSSVPSPTVQVIVDSSLFYNPLSLRFTDSSGHVTIPRDSSGRTDATGWSIFLRRGTLYTVSVTICCDDPNAVVTLELGSFATVTLTDPDSDGTYTASFTTPSTGPIQGTIRICVVCELIKRCSDGELTIDPEGTVFNVLTGNPVAAANVACLQAQSSGGNGETVFNLWPASDFKQINPQTTGSDGYFSFFTPPGTYRLQISAAGYQKYMSRDLTVVAEPVHFDPPLTPIIEQVADYTVMVGPDGFVPQVLSVLPGSVIAWVNQDSVVHATVSLTPTVLFEMSAASLGSSDGWDSGLLSGGDSYKRQLATLGSYTYYDSENPTATGTILVVEKLKDPEEPTADRHLYLPTVTR